MTNDIKIERPKFSFDEPEYNFQNICSMLGMITLGDVAFRPEAIVLMEDGMARDADGEAPDATFTDCCTLVHFANQQSVELDADQMVQLEKFLRDVRAAMQQAMAANNPLTVPAVRDVARDLARKAGLKFDGK